MSPQLPVKSENSFSQLPDYIAIGNSNYLPIVLEGGTASHLPHIQWQENTGESAGSIAEGRYSAREFFNNNRQFIQLEESFKKQLHQYIKDVFQTQNTYSLNEKMKLSTEAILNCFPDKVSLELTKEGSIFYTFLKDDYTVYFQHFLMDEFDGNDEALISIFKGEENIINFAGSFIDSVNKLNKSLFSKLSTIYEIA